jgi:hypothetical protein
MHQSTVDSQKQRMPVSFTELEAIHLQPTSNPIANGDVECVIRRGDYVACVARSPWQRLAASKLVEKMYASRGYATQSMTHIPHDAKRITFKASNKTQLVGTLTLGFDGHSGLLADRLYGQEIGRFRDDGRVVCELSKLAVDPEHGSKELLASLIQLAHIYARVLNRATDAFIEVNPRHAVFYKRMLGFQQIGDEKTCARVGAPAVLLHLELSYMDEQVARHSGRRSERVRSLYPYFLQPHEISNDASAVARAA